MPERKSDSDPSPRSTCDRESSHFAVSSGVLSESHTMSISVSPRSVAESVLPRRRMYLALISFSIMLARVAGVPRPPECIESSSMAAFSSRSSMDRPACSMADRSVASV